MTSQINRPVRIGVQVAPQHLEYFRIREVLTQLEELGVDIAFNWDHFFPLSGDPDGTHFEAWTMLAAWAEQTTTLEFGPLVTCNSYRNPELLADMARTVDHISAKKAGDVGRLIFGIGSGWFERDYLEYGYDFTTVGARLNSLAAAMPRIVDRWGKLNPTPTRDIPILIGGSGEKKTLPLVAQYASIWHSFADVDAFERKVEILTDYTNELGRDISEIEFSTGVSVRAGVGSASEQVFEQKYDLGVRLFTYGLTGPDIDLGPVRELLAWRDAKNATA